MSGPLSVTADELRTLATFLDQLSEATRQTGWRVGAYQGPDVVLDGAGGEITMRLKHVGDKYVIDDRIGD